MKDENCAYCMRNELLDQFGIFVCELPASILVLFKEQSHPGRCIVAAKQHVSEITDMTEDEMDAFYRDVRHVAAAELPNGLTAPIPVTTTLCNSILQELNY